MKIDLGSLSKTVSGYLQRLSLSRFLTIIVYGKIQLKVNLNGRSYTFEKQVGKNPFGEKSTSIYTSMDTSIGLWEAQLRRQFL